VRERLIRHVGPLLARVRVLPFRLSRRRLGLALMYHAVGEGTGDPQHELVPTRGADLFEKQLRHLRAVYRLVPASKLVEAASSRRRGQRFPVAVTFDDDLRSHTDVAMPLLRALGVPATFFLSGASLDRPRPFWWQWMQHAFDHRDQAAVRRIVEARHEGGLCAENLTIHRLASVVEQLPPDAQEEVAVELAALTGSNPPDPGLDADHVRALARAGFEIGFHTLRHLPLPGLDDASLATALREGRDRLAELAGGELTTIAYPHGKANERVAGAANEAGFATGFTSLRAVVRPGANPLLLGRIAPSFASEGQFALELARLLRPQ
jgi:peptidoglycan/xylan/chitin deacetylase (PgdA/CDA1 family)